MSVDETLSSLVGRYSATQQPVQVSFRELLKDSVTRDSTTHGLHSYPAKLFAAIPSFFLRTSLTRPGDLVVDPFCGSGTVLLEAMLAGRNSAGADANPLAGLITRVKVTPLSEWQLEQARGCLDRLPTRPERDYPDVVNMEYWFYPHVRRDLLRILARIKAWPEPAVRDFLLVTFSACIKDVSLADPRLSVPVRLREDQYASGHWLHEKTKARLRSLRRIDVVKAFQARLSDNLARMKRLSSHSGLGQFVGVTPDARSLYPLSTASADLVLTSPPYVSAQKYIRASSLSLTWLGLCTAKQLRSLEEHNIGREHYRADSYAKPLEVSIPSATELLAKIRAVNPLRAHLAATYLLEMRDAFREIARVLRPGKHAIIVVGASHVCRMPFPTPHFLCHVAQQCGLKLRLHVVDAIRSRALMTKRHRTAAQIDTESILLFEKQ